MLSLLDRRFGEDFNITLLLDTHTYDQIRVVSDDSEYEFHILIGEGYELEQSRLRELNGSQQEVYIIHTESSRIEKYSKMKMSWTVGNSGFWGCWPNSGDIEIALENFEHMDFSRVRGMPLLDNHDIHSGVTA